MGAAPGSRTKLHGEAREVAERAGLQSCPICKTDRAFSRKPVTIAEGSIYLCGTCEGYFLFPSLEVPYDDSGWTEMRQEQWTRDVARGHEFAARIARWYTDEMGSPLGSVLEVGCGSAFMAPGFAEQGVSYTGIDVDRASVSFAREEGLDVEEIAVEDLPDSPLGERRFDLVLSSNALEHVSDPVRAFEAIRRVTGSLAAVVVPNPEGLLPRLKANRSFLRLVQKLRGSDRVIAYSIDGYWHNIAYSRRSLAYLSGLSGLNVRKLRSISINDRVFGFVQPNESLLYRCVSRAAGLVDMDSQLLLVAD